MDRPVEPGTSGLMFSGQGERRPVRELYGAFRRPANDADRRVGSFVARTGTLHRLEPAVVQSEGRLLLAGLGGDMDMVFAVPAGEQVAFTVLPMGGGMGHVPGPDGLLVLQHQTEVMDLVVHGLVGDVIEAVDLVVAGVTHRAQMGENAFALRLEQTHEADQERLVLHRRDGTTNVIELRPES